MITITLNHAYHYHYYHEKAPFNPRLVPYRHRKAWEHAHHESAAERRKAAAKAEIERMRKEELLGREVLHF